MPTYDYQCSNCGAAFEKFQSIKAGPIRKCPKCGKNALKRLIGTGAGLIFKGSGFYITDYRSESYKDAAKADTAPKPAEGKSADSKPTDAKPAEAKTAEAKPSKESAAPAKTEAPKAAPAPPKSASKSAAKRKR
jgi:putative FmdB family regulatory protein